MSIKFGYDSYGNSIDGTDYCSGVETFAQNLIEDNESDTTISFPSPNGWATPRTEDYILTDSNAKMIVSEKIYRPLKIYVSPDYFRVTVHVDNGVTYVMLGAVKDINGNPINGANIVDYVVEQAVFNTLPAAKSGGLNKGNVFYYTQGDNKINFGEDIHKIFGFDIIPNYVSLFKKWAEEATAKKIFSEYYIDFAGEQLKLSEHEYKIEYFDQSVDYSALKVKDIKYRVSYIPMSSDIKLRARKSVRQQEEYIQILNQRAEINSASALGKFMYNTAQKMGTEQITLVKFYTKIGDIPPLGCRVKHNGQHYILTANSIEMTNCVQVKVTHTLSKNWSNKSQYVSVDQKYRNYKIPADILWRNMLWEDHVVVSKQSYETEIENKGSLLAGKWLPHLYCNRNGDVTVTSLFLTRKDPVTQRNIGAVVPCTTLGPAKSIVFAGSMKDQLSAGLRINPSQPDYCEEVFYCDDNGKLKEGTITLADNIEHFDAAQYPYTEWSVQDGQEYYLNSPGYDVFRVTFSIDKDPGEALKFIYQCHFVEDDPDILIGDKLTETHHLIKKWPTDRKFRFWRLNRFLRQGVDKVYSQDGEYRQIDADTDREKYWTISIDQTDRSGTLTLQFHANNYLRAGNVGWAITDENNNLYIGCNDVSTRKLIFNFMHEWK